MSGINIRKITKETPIVVGNTLNKPFIAIGLSQTVFKDSKAKYLGLWVDDVVVAKNLMNAFEACIKYIEKNDGEKHEVVREKESI